jgi:hypothetical protein
MVSVALADAPAHPLAGAPRSSALAALIRARTCLYHWPINDAQADVTADPADTV